MGGECVIDSSGNVYLSGSTSSPANISFNGFQNSYSGSSDAFLVKFNSAGTRLWATYYGGITWEYSGLCSMDKYENIYIVGFTRSTNLGSGGFQNTISGIQDAFITKFNSNGNRIWSTYFGGNDYDTPGNCTIDDDFLYICGNTSSSSGISMNGFQNNPVYTNSYYPYIDDGFLAKIDISKSSVIFCPNGSTTVTCPITGSTYQCEASPDGIIWSNLVGVTSQNLSLANVPSTSYGYQYRCKVNGTTYTDPYQLKFENRWVGTTNTAWENPANWSCGVLPDGNTDVIINNGPVVLNSNGICRTLTVRPGVSFTVTTGNTLTITH